MLLSSLPPERLNSTVNADGTTISVDLTSQYNLHNFNYFGVKIVTLEAKIMYEMSIVKNLTIATNKEVKPREFKKFDLMVENIVFGPENHLSWVATVCTSP